MAAIVTLTSDFGSKDAFTGSMRGAILKVNPAAQIFDISNDIGPQDIWEAAFTLRNAYSYFPKDTIHLAVVDPGVGSSRRPILVKTENFYFVGPDNGIFSLIYTEAERLRVIHITASHYFLPSISPTFHGRDIFAPVAGWLTKGLPIENFGEEVTDYVKMNIPTAKKSPEGIDGNVIHIDRFGNAITNIKYAEIRELIPNEPDLANTSVTLVGKEIKGLKPFYAAAAPGELAALANSSGYLEIFMFKQNARTALSLKRGEAVKLSIKPK